MEMDKNTKILVIEDNLAAIEEIQGILWTTPYLCAITLKWSLQALKEITDGTVKKMGLIVDGSFFNFRNSSKKEEFFREPLNPLDLREWRDSLGDDKHYSHSEAEIFMDTLFSTEDFSVKDDNQKNAYLRYLLLNRNTNSPWSFFVGFTLRILKEKGLRGIPLCFLLNSSDSSMNGEMSRIIWAENFSNIKIVSVPEWKKNDPDSIRQLLQWACNE